MSKVFTAADFFDLPETPAPKAKRDQTAEVIRLLERGDVFTVGKSRWVTLHDAKGSMQVYATKDGTRGKKLYTALSYGDDNAMVFESSGSGKFDESKPVAKGPLRHTGTRIRM